MDAPVVELIKGLVQVRDGLSLIAFLTLALLIAFRTEKVPELFFGLVRDKLTRQQFASLLHRFMTLAFAAFCVLVVLTLASQMLKNRTEPDAPSELAFQSELAKINASIDEKLEAERKYREAADFLQQKRLEDAILSLKQSIDAVPTVAAQETLIFIYIQVGDIPNASAAKTAAITIASERGDTLVLVRLERTQIPPAPAKPDPGPEPVQHSDTKPQPLPVGGNSIANAVVIDPGFYFCAEASGCVEAWFNISVTEGQQIELMVRGPQNGENSWPRIRISGPDGRELRHGEVGDISKGKTFSKTYIAPTSGLYFLYTRAEESAVLSIKIR
jgi:hypothetical protein